MAVISKQKNNLMAAVLRSLDRESFLINERSAMLKQELREIQHKLQSESSSEKSVLLEREQEIKSQLAEIQKEKDIVNAHTNQIAERTIKEKQVAFEASKAVVDHAEKQKLERLPG